MSKKLPMTTNQLVKLRGLVNASLGIGPLGGILAAKERKQAQAKLVRFSGFRV